MMNIRDLFKASKWRLYNVEVAKTIGVNPTLVLMELADAEDRYSNSDGWFFTTYAKIANNTALSYKQVASAVKILRDSEIINTEMRGIPAKMNFYLNAEKLVFLIGENNLPQKGITSDYKKVKLGITKGDNKVLQKGSAIKQERKEQERKEQEHITRTQKGGKSEIEIIYPFTSERFYTAWEGWVQYRKESKIKKYTARGLNTTFKHLREICGGSEDMALEIIEQSIAQGWQGLFPIKNNNFGKPNSAERQKAYREELYKDLQEGYKEY